MLAGMYRDPQTKRYALYKLTFNGLLKYWFGDATNEFGTSFILVLTDAKFDFMHFLQAEKFRKVTIRLPFLSMQVCDIKKFF